MARLAMMDGGNMKSEWTPGPWYYRKPIGIFGADNRPILLHTYTQTSAHRTPEEIDANYYLISKGPQMANLLFRMHLWLSRDPEFLEAEADRAASLGENPSSTKIEQQLIEEAEFLIAEILCKSSPSR